MLCNVIVDNRPGAGDNLGIRTIADQVEHATKNPGKLNYGSGGNGSAGRLAGEMFKSKAGVFMVPIPYGGGGSAQLALLSGQVDLTFDNLATASANIRSGKLRGRAREVRTGREGEPGDGRTADLSAATRTAPAPRSARARRPGRSTRGRSPGSGHCRR